ncbi:MAG: nucleotide exchange factor GrpE [Bacteroidetes bacterium]|nr:nucleotide exchange factor GrpE [Bacteroidota bacterium]MDA1268320.1 nucleotide exchange factor GrpE [Bacteroidota bacterium]
MKPTKINIPMENKNQEQQESKLKFDENQLEETSPEVGESVEENDPSQEEKLTAEVAELKEKYLRLYSDFENFRKRTAKERIELIKTASEEVLKDLIPVVDDFERAFKAAEKEADTQKIQEGNQLIFQKLVKILESNGLKSMEELIGQPFNPDTQEAITQIPSPSPEFKGAVVDVVEKGYFLGEKVVRCAKVVTGA